MTGLLAPSRRLLPARRLGTPIPPLPPRARAAAVVPNATLVVRSELSPTMAIFEVQPDAGVPPFLPGQYFALGLPADGGLLQRPYSASSAGPSSVLEFAIRLVPGGAFTPRLWRLGPGARLRIGPPKGLFRLLDEDARAHLLLATGTGIAPLVAMAGALARRRWPPRTVIVHGAARADELAFRDRLVALALDTPRLSYSPTISRPGDPFNAGWDGRVGRLDTLLGPILAELALAPATSVAYVCGNPAMIAGVTERLLALGLDREAIRAEPY